MMARQKKGEKRKQVQKKKRVEGSLVLGKRNVWLMMIGIVIILLGYLLLGRGSISAAPFLLVLGYCVLVPLSIMLWVRQPDEKPDSEMGE
jgi:phosphatidylglycerophosphate synthase